MRRGKFSLILATMLWIVLLMVPAAGLGADRLMENSAAHVASVVSGDDGALMPVSPLGGGSDGSDGSVQSGDDDDPGETIIYVEPDEGEFDFTRELWMVIQLWSLWF